MYKVYVILAVFAVSNASLLRTINQNTCSLSRQRRSLSRTNIFGGKFTFVSEFPHMVALGYGTPESPYWNCGGVLISTNFVLTAAHCLYSREDGPVNFIRAGTTILSRPSSTYKDYKVVEAIPHPKYTYPKMYHDIALLKLNTSVALSPHVKVACLDTGFNGNRTDFTAIGWGSLTQNRNLSDNLMKVDLVSYDLANCKKHYIQQQRELPEGVREDLMICAGGSKDEQKDTCFGDSGGPLQVAGDQNIVVGLTSFGKICATPNVPGIYTKVSSYIKWIEENIS